MGTLEGSPLVTPFCLKVLKKCSATSQELSEALSHKTIEYQKAFDELRRLKPTTTHYSLVPKRRLYGPDPSLLL
ncbi:hypothetical protein NHJ13734_000911 [Beauveria thailandica]